MSVPAYSDIAKASNDLLNKDFYHTSAASLEVKTTTPNDVTFNVKGKSSHEGSTSGSLEGKYKDEATGIQFHNLFLVVHFPPPQTNIRHMLVIGPYWTKLLMSFHGAGLTLTPSWSTANALDAKVELDNMLTKGLKGEFLGTFLPKSTSYGAKANLYFKQPNYHLRAFVDILKGPTATVDAVVGRNGFLVGAEGGYDIQQASITKYSASVGYTQSVWAAAINASNNMSVFSASYYHKVNSEVEAGAKATWDSKAGNNVGLEVAGKYRLDPTAFAKAKVNDRGIAAIAYNVVVRPGFTLGLGASFDTQKKMNESAHKIGASFTFNG